MLVSAWKGATFGIRVGTPNALQYFQRDWKGIEVEVDGVFHSFNLSQTFWTTCPEFRGGPILRWLKDQGLIPWPKGNPPQFELVSLGGNRFRLNRIRSAG